MNVRSRHISRFLFISLLLVLFNNSFLFSADKEIGGVINKYARVTFIPASPTATITVSDVTNFSEGDTILLIQMQGASIYTTDDALYGFLDHPLGKVGGYEFLIIQNYCWK